MEQLWHYIQDFIKSELVAIHVTLFSEGLHPLKSQSIYEHLISNLVAIGQPDAMEFTWAQHSLPVCMPR